MSSDAAAKDCKHFGALTVVQVTTRNGVASFYRCETCRRPFRRRGDEHWQGAEKTPASIRVRAGLTPYEEE